jgi:rubrerythrin
MADEPKPIDSPQPVITKVRSALSAPPCENTDTMLCERCGAAMYRMHAVWRCPACRFKTDCCGW